MPDSILSSTEATPQQSGSVYQSVRPKRFQGWYADRRCDRWATPLVMPLFIDGKDSFA
jgi:hypothetical protein